MKPKTLRFIGIALGLVFLYIGTYEFMRSYREGDTKWNYMVMLFGMTLVLFYTIFKKSLSKKRKK